MVTKTLVALLATSLAATPSIAGPHGGWHGHGGGWHGDGGGHGHGGGYHGGWHGHGGHGGSGFSV